MTHPSQLANPTSTIEEATTLFSRQITSAQSWKRGPYKLEAALEQAASAPPQDSLAIFLSQGHSVWLAYFLAKSAYAIHHEDPQIHAETLTAFEYLSVGYRTSVANRLASVNVHTTLQSTMHRIESILTPSKRRRKFSRRWYANLPLQASARAQQRATTLSCSTNNYPIEHHREEARICLWKPKLRLSSEGPPHT